MTKLKESYYMANLSGQLPTIISAESGIFNPHTRGLVYRVDMMSVEL